MAIVHIALFLYSAHVDILLLFQGKKKSPRNGGKKSGSISTKLDTQPINISSSDEEDKTPYNSPVSKAIPQAAYIKYEIFCADESYMGKFLKGYGADKPCLMINDFMIHDSSSDVVDLLDYNTESLEKHPIFISGFVSAVDKPNINKVSYFHLPLLFICSYFKHKS